MEYEIRTRSPRTRQLIEYVMPSLISQLGLKRNRSTVYIQVSNRCGDDNDGSTVAMPEFNSYVITLRPGDLFHMGTTLAHEMVHVKQLVCGTLKSVNGVRYWRGRRYTRRTKYMNCPWELDAFARQEILFRRALEN
jgi:hypothetical protein